MNSTTILRSPTLARGGPVHAVRLYECGPYARGGLARTMPAREMMMHLSAPEMAQLRARWGAPRMNAQTGAAEYGFAPGSLKRMADGGSAEADLFRSRTAITPDYYTYGAGPEQQFYSQNVTPSQPDYVHLPETPTGPTTQSAGSSANNLAGVGSVLTGGAALAKVLGYDNAITQGASTAGKLASGNYVGAAKSGLKLYNSMNSPSMADFASGKATSDALTEAGFSGSGAPPLQFDEAGNVIDSGAGATGAVTKAGPSTASRALGGVGGALNIYGGLKQGGVQGYAQAGTGAAQIAGAAGVGGSTVAQAVPVLGAITGGYGTLKSIQAGDKKSAALSGAATGASIGSIVPGIGTALGAVIGGLVGAAGAAIHGKDYAEEKVRDKYYDLLDPKTGNYDTSQQVDPKSFYQAVAGEFRGSHSAFAPRSSGKYGKKDEDKFIADMADKINAAYTSGAIGKGATTQDVMSKVIDPWFQSDFGGWRTDIPQEWQADQRAMTSDLVNRYISGSPVDWGVITGSGPNSAHPVASYLGLGKARGGLAAISSQHVRGPGTGRSDSIPAQLSDGEYVLTAEDVALLGDGSNEAGAQRLDEFRQQLRKHKGTALARGKISPNAKAPMQYLRGGR